jgi:hypothetical protein
MLDTAGESAIGVIPRLADEKADIDDFSLRLPGVLVESETPTGPGRRKNSQQR